MNRELVSVLSALVTTASISAQPASRPNVLFCIADDASAMHFSANGCSWVHTPHFDRVARSGLLFANCYTPNAKSAPSRAVLLTGRYSWQLKEAGNHIANFPAEYKVFPEVLAEAGYDVGMTGKGWGPGNPGIVHGKTRQLTGRPYQQHKTQPPTPQISNYDYARNFAQFLDENDGRPWFFWMGAREPHRDYSYGSGVRVGGYSLARIDSVPSFLPDCEEVRNDLLDYALEIEYYDRQIGLMLEELEKRNLLDNTIVIVTSDNGMPFPRSKANSYEYSCHMPMAVMWGAGIQNPGRVIARYLNFVDIAPTILDVCGIEVAHCGMAPMSGRSFKPIFEHVQSEVLEEEDYTLLGRERCDYGRPRNQGYPIRGIIRDGFLYLYNFKNSRYPAGNPETGYLDIDGSPSKTVILNLKRSGMDDGYYRMSMGKRPAEELYDLTRDRDCIKNLARDARYSDLRKELRAILFRALKETADPRVCGDGDVFDRYPFHEPASENFYERVRSGELREPWKQTRWVNESDYER